MLRVYFQPLPLIAALLASLLHVTVAAQTGGSWIDPNLQNKTIYPTASTTDHRHRLTNWSSEQLSTESATRTIWPKALSESEKGSMARQWLPQAFADGSSSDTPAKKRRSMATPLMLRTLMQASERFQVDAYLIKAVIHAESAFNPHARSPKNAIGLMQVLPATARDLGLMSIPSASVEQLLTDPRVSIVVGTKYLAEQLERFGGNVELAIAAYNAGPGAVIKAGNKIPPYPETRVYVQRVLSLARSYRQKQTLEAVRS